MCDSTNAEREGFTKSEGTIGKIFDDIFGEHRESRLIIATFASNVDRVQQIINTAHKYDRKVAVEGRSMVNVIETATELGYIQVPENTLVDLNDLRNYPDERTVIITTGSQGESMAALSRMAQDIHKKVTIRPSDTIVFSSTPIPGNEKAVDKVINELEARGAEVIFQDVHVSGHACREEIKLIYSLVKPRYALPVHGEIRHRHAQARIAKELGYDSGHILMLHSGDVLEIADDGSEPKVTGQVHTGTVYVDGLGVGDVGSAVLHDRQHLAEDGVVVIALAMESGTNQVLSGPDIVSRGFVYVRESEELLEDAREVLEETIEELQDRNVNDWGKIRQALRERLSGYIWQKTKRRPMILPVIMEI